MQIRPAGEADTGHLAELLTRFAAQDELAGPQQGFEQDLLGWWRSHRDSHVPFLALLDPGTAVGMAWLAITARVPRPGRTSRLCGDVQSVYVVPEHRSAGVGTALLREVSLHAESLGLEHVTVHSSTRAASLYRRAGFAASETLLVNTSAPGGGGVTNDRTQ